MLTLKRNLFKKCLSLWVNNRLITGYNTFGEAINANDQSEHTLNHNSVPRFQNSEDGKVLKLPKILTVPAKKFPSKRTYHSF